MIHPREVGKFFFFSINSPTRRSPSFEKATTDGVVLDPSAFSKTFGVLPSITATHEFVVPKSIPITCPCTLSDLKENLTHEKAVYLPFEY